MRCEHRGEGVRPVSPDPPGVYGRELLQGAFLPADGRGVQSQFHGHHLGHVRPSVPGIHGCQPLVQGQEVRVRPERLHVMHLGALGIPLQLTDAPVDVRVSRQVLHALELGEQHLGRIQLPSVQKYLDSGHQGTLRVFGRGLDHRIHDICEPVGIVRVGEPEQARHDDGIGRGFPVGGIQPDHLGIRTRGLSRCAIGAYLVDELHRLGELLIAEKGDLRFHRPSIV